MSAPNLLRVGTAEKVFVEIQDCLFEENVNVQIRVLNHPTKTTLLASTSVTLTKENKFQELGQIMVMENYWRMLLMRLYYNYFSNKIVYFILFKAQWWNRTVFVGIGTVDLDLTAKSSPNCQHCQYSFFFSFFFETQTHYCLFAKVGYLMWIWLDDRWSSSVKM